MMSWSSIMCAVKNTIGVSRNRFVFLMSCANSKPPMPGILMSSTMAATWCSSKRRSAPSASCERRRRYPGLERITSSASRLRASSSTRRMSMIDVILTIGPYAEQREQLVGVDRFGDVVGGAGLQTFLAVALHRLGGEGQDGKRAKLGVLSD